MSYSREKLQRIGVRLTGCTVLPVLVFGFEGNAFEAVACLTVAALAPPAYSITMLVLALLLSAPVLLSLSVGLGIQEAFVVLPSLHFAGFRGAEILVTTHCFVLLERILRRKLLDPATHRWSMLLAKRRNGQLLGFVCYVEAAICAYAASAGAMPASHAFIWVVTLISLSVLLDQVYWSALPDDVIARHTRRLGQLFGLIGAGHVSALLCLCIALLGAIRVGVRPVFTPATWMILIGLGAAGFGCAMAYRSLARDNAPAGFGHVLLAAAHVPIYPVGTILGLHALRTLIFSALRNREPPRTAHPVCATEMRTRSADCSGSRALVSAASAIGVYLFVTTAMWVQVYRVLDPPVTSVMLLRNSDGVPVVRDWIALGELPEHFVPEVLNAEDCSFYRHYGFDWNRTQHALQIAMRGEEGPGASTITQQVAKNCFLWPQRSWIRKGLEAYFTVLIETTWEKDRILEVYVNVAETAQGVFGVESGAQTFYAKPASQLTKKESLRLIEGLPRAGFIVPGEPAETVAIRKRRPAAMNAQVAAKQND